MPFAYFISLQQLSKAVNERFEGALVSKASQHKALRVLKEAKPDTSATTA